MNIPGCDKHAGSEDDLMNEDKLNQMLSQFRKRVDVEPEPLDDATVQQRSPKVFQVYLGRIIAPLLTQYWRYFASLPRVKCDQRTRHSDVGGLELITSVHMNVQLRRGYTVRVAFGVSPDDAGLRASRTVRRPGRQPESLDEIRPFANVDKQFVDAFIENAIAALVAEW